MCKYVNLLLHLDPHLMCCSILIPIHIELQVVCVCVFGSMYGSFLRQLIRSSPACSRKKSISPLPPYMHTSITMQQYYSKEFVYFQNKKKEFVYSMPSVICFSVFQKAMWGDLLSSCIHTYLIQELHTSRWIAQKLDSSRLLKKGFVRTQNVAGTKSVV